MATKTKLQGEISLEQLKAMVSTNQACLIYGGLSKHGLDTWEALEQWRNCTAKEVKSLLNQAFGAYQYDYKVIKTLFGINVYSDSTVKIGKNNRCSLSTAIGNRLTAFFGSYSLAMNSKHLFRGLRKPVKANICYLSVALKANGAWHKTHTKSEILDRY